MEQFISPLITLVSILIAAFVAYQTWLSPFHPTVEMRPLIWRLGPGNPPSCPLTVVIYSTFFNTGSISGVVSDLLLEEADAAFGLDDASCDFQKPEPKGRELRGCEIADLWNGVADGEQEPIGGGMEDEANLVGKGGTATGAN